MFFKVAKATMSAILADLAFADWNNDVFGNPPIYCIGVDSTVNPDVAPDGITINAVHPQSGGYDSGNDNSFREVGVVIEVWIKANGSISDGGLQIIAGTKYMSEGMCHLERIIKSLWNVKYDVSECLIDPAVVVDTPNYLGTISFKVRAERSLSSTEIDFTP